MSDQAQDHRQFRAVISDDDEFFRVALKSVLLDRNGFSEVIETASFDEAVDQLAKVGAVDVGLFDLNMLGMENWLDLAAVRKEYPDMRLVVVSASRLREDILNAPEIGVHGFIHKGQGAAELSRAVNLICEGQVYVPAFLPDHICDTPPQSFAPAPLTDGASDRLAAPDNPTVPDSQPHKVDRPQTLNCSPRQREIIELLIAGHSNKGMARALNLSEGTIKFHMSAVLRLLGASSRVEAATRAMRILSR